MKTLTPQLIREREFAELTETTAQVLDHPYVQDALGSIAVDLARINETAFLPDITGGVVHIPEQHQPTNYVAVIPVAYQAVRPKFWLPKTYRRVDGSYFLDESSCQPTPNMKRMGYERLVADGCTEEDAEEIIANIMWDAEPLTVLKVPSPGDAGVRCEIGIEPDSATRITSRPVVVTNFMPSTLSAVEKALVMIHEYQHVRDFESSCVLPDDSVVNRAADESRAYHIEVEARLALRAAGFRPWNAKSDAFAYEVDEVRREHTTDGDPYATPPELIAKYQELSVLK